MAYHMWIFCQEDATDLTPADLMGAMEDTDWWILAEYHGFSEELIDPSLDSLRIEADVDEKKLHLLYRSREERQVRIDRLIAPGQVREEIREAIEGIADDQDGAAARVREHLRNVKCVVVLTMGISQLKDMGIAFASEIALYFADQRNGLMRDDDGKWYCSDDGAYKPL